MPVVSTVSLQAARGCRLFGFIAVTSRLCVTIVAPECMLHTVLLPVVGALSYQYLWSQAYGCPPIVAACCLTSKPLRYPAPRQVSTKYSGTVTHMAVSDAGPKNGGRNCRA